MIANIQSNNEHTCFFYLVLLAISFNSANCAPIRYQPLPGYKKNVIIAKSTRHDGLANVNFHEDFRIINLAADLTTRIPRKFYLKDCSDKQYFDWYLNEYPPECQFHFSNATSLKDLLMVYCDALCGNTYLSYIERCGKTATEMVQYYRKLCQDTKDKTRIYIVPT